ncbi:MAG: AtpZ/AtpI family protein [Deltaproteobacteria bacterium]|nr:AtpZ/AtpI family protein [Deltaproteobacteria bacterium]
MEQPEQPHSGKSHIFPGRTSGPPGRAKLGGAFFRAGVIGLHPVSGLVVGGAAGYFLWKKLDAPWCFWTLLLVGFVAGCLNAYRDIRHMMREEDGGHAAKKPHRD